MKISSPNKFVAGILVSCLIGVSHAQEPDTLWRLRVMDLSDRVRVEATIRFAREPATESCLAGTWKRIVVEENTANEGAFFPLSEPLAYELKSGVLTLGRTALCDGYSLLTGRFEESSIHGIYNAVGIKHSEKLGYFSLDKIQWASIASTDAALLCPLRVNSGPWAATGRNGLILRHGGRFISL